MLIIFNLYAIIFIVFKFNTFRVCMLCKLYVTRIKRFTDSVDISNTNWRRNYYTVAYRYTRDMRCDVEEVRHQRRIFPKNVCHSLSLKEEILPDFAEKADRNVATGIRWEINVFCESIFKGRLFNSA